MVRIGIFGGSFNPVHLGHLRLAEVARQELGLARVIFVPTFATPLKDKQTLLPAPLRLRLLRLALKKNRHFTVSDVEIGREGTSYTVDTLKYFKNKFERGSKEPAILYFLTGADTLKNIFRWKSLGQVLKLCRFVVMTRPGYRLKKSLPGVMLLPMGALDISSSDIRARLESGRSVQGLAVPSTVPALKKYIQGGLRSKRRKS